MKITLKKAFACDLFIALLVFGWTLYIGSYFIYGDQKIYRSVYAGLPEYGLADGFLWYQTKIMSIEVVHYFYSWFMSRVLEKDVAMAIANAALAFVSLRVLRFWGASPVIAVLVIFLGYYWNVLYFSAERLKFAFLLLGVAFLYKEDIKRWGFFSALALLAHAQSLILIVSTSLRYFVRSFGRVFRSYKINVPLLVALVVFLVAFLLLYQQIAYKAEAYFSRDGLELSHTYKLLIFLAGSLFYSKDKRGVFFVFGGLLGAAYLFGDTRVNMYGYLVFMYYSVQVRGGWNVGFLGAFSYYAVGAIGNISNILQYGTHNPLAG